MALTDMAAATSDASQETKPMLVIGERDIVFSCPACSGELVVDREGAGMQVPCPHCGQSLVIPSQAAAGSEQALPASPTFEPQGSVPLAPARCFDFSGVSHEQIEQRAGDLARQLKENRSQDTEMRGHVNRATMELHRLQLRLKKLHERQADIEAELTAIQALSGEAS